MAVQIIVDVADAIKRKLMALRLERANQSATVLLLRQRARQLNDVADLADAAGLAA